MKEKLKLYGAVLILILVIPYLMTVYFQGSSGKMFLSKDQELSQMEETVIRMVAGEISGGEETESLKAQAVIARTNLYRNPDQEIVENDSVLAEYLDEITFCVEETKGEILTWQGDPIDAAYHAVSAKKTRNAGEVPGQEAKTYLSGADSSADITSPQYLKVSYLTKEDMAKKIQTLLKDEKVDASGLPENLVIKERDLAGYVTKVQYGNTILNGEAIKEALDLPSACFYFSQLNGQIRMMTKGLGHGLGLSQYGANEMAKSGKDYKDILHYYYREVEIEQMKNP